jgi:hypothetical protein
MRRVRSSASVPVDPLEPMLSTVASGQVLKIVGDRNTLSFDGAKEILLNWIAVVAEGDFDWALETVEVAVVTGSLISFVLLHQRNELFGGPALGLEVIIVGSRGASVHLAEVSRKADFGAEHTYHEVDGRTSTKDVSTGHNCSASIKPFRWS